MYVGVVFQAFFGAFVRWRSAKQLRKRIALDTMLHHWLGRGLFLLGLAQVPLGLYIYGSPLILFILYAIFVALFILAWFILEFLRTRGYFTHGFIGSSGDLPIHEMSEVEHSALGPRQGEVINHNRYEEPEPVLQTPRRARFSLFSNVFKKREPGMNRESEQLVMDDRGTSFETSRAPSAHSPAMGGLHAPPGRQNNIPPVPSIPSHIPGPEGALLHIDNQDRYIQPNHSMRQNGYRDSTTLGHSAQPISMPEPPTAESPYVSDRTNSGGIGDISSPVSDVSALSSGNLRSFPYQPVPIQQYEEMPPSPMMDGRYMEADNGFIHGPLNGPQGNTIEPPMMPLPMPPEPHARRQSHSRGRSNEDVVRLPISHSNEFLTIDRREATPGFETIRPSKNNPNVSVQVRVNPDGKSVTVRRIPTDEAERDRKERARQRAERATQREISMDRDRQMRRSSSARRSRRSSSVDQTDTDNPIFSPTGPDSNVSSAIAGHSGGLLGGASVIPPQPSRNPQQYQSPQDPSREALRTPLSGLGHPLPGMTYTGLGGGLSPSQRGSVVSASVGSELEQEMAKDYRRKKRRDERSGNTSSFGVGGSTLMSSSIDYGDDSQDGGISWN